MRNKGIEELYFWLQWEGEGVSEEWFSNRSLIFAHLAFCYGLRFSREEFLHFFAGVFFLWLSLLFLDAELFALVLDLLCESLKQADEELLGVVLGIALEVGAVLLEDALEGAGVD